MLNNMTKHYKFAKHHCSWVERGLMSLMISLREGQIRISNTGDQLNKPDVWLENNLHGFSHLSPFKQANLSQGVLHTWWSNG